MEIGRTDPRFRYETRQREARPADQDIPDGTISFGFQALPGRPREFKVTVRVGEAVEELAAEPREDVELPPPLPWFSDTLVGDRHRREIRQQLALGDSAIVSLGPDVGLDAGPLPDRFRALADPDGVLRTGNTEIGLSEPVVLTIVAEGSRGRSPEMPVQLRRAPSAPGYDVSYGGNVHGVLVYVELQTDAAPPEGVKGSWTESSIALELAIDRRPAADALLGLGFALAITQATHLHLECPGVLPQAGIDFDDAAETAVAAGDTLEHALMLADALARLEALDGCPRPVPASYAPDDLLLAQVVEAISHGQPARILFPRGAEVRVGEEFVLYDSSSGTGPLGPLGGHPTLGVNIRAEDPRSARLSRSNHDGRVVIRVDGDSTEMAIYVTTMSRENRSSAERGSDAADEDA